MKPIDQILTDGHIGAPETDQAIRLVEEQLAIQLPEELRLLYLKYGSIREPLGNTPYLLPLREDHGAGSLVSITSFYWHELPNLNPKAPDLSLYLFFGNSSGDEHWGIELAEPHRLIAYHHLMGDDVECVGNSITDLFATDFALYDA